MGSPRQDITLEQRIGIGLAAVANRGVYGTVSALAREYQTSRQFIYTLEKRVMSALEGALMPRRAGPRARSYLLEIDREHLDRSILSLAMLGHAPERAICECLGAILRVEPSLGYVNGVLMRASRAASQFNEGLRLALPEAEVGIDELYAQRKGNLVAVEPHSLLILAMKETERVDGASWQETVGGMADQGVRIARLASDGGTAIKSLVARWVGVEHYLDLWHALRHMGRAVRELESGAYGAIAREEALGRKAKRMPDSPMMGGVVREDYRRAKRATQLAIERYEALRLLSAWARQALDPVETKSGRIRSRTECAEELQAATELMRELGVPAARKLADYLDGAAAGLLAYLDRLQTLVGQIVAELGEEGVQLLCREWQLEKVLARHQGEDQTNRHRDYLRAHLLCLLYWSDGYPAARKRVAGVLGSILRGSSLVECVNSLLRPYAQLRKSLGQAFLDLFALYRNCRVFQRGKRAGASPFQLAGIHLPEGAWTDHLGFGHDHTSRRSLRSLPKAA